MFNIPANPLFKSQKQVLIKDKKYIGINSNTKDDAFNEVQDHNRMIPLICPSIVNVGGRMNETFKLA